MNLDLQSKIEWKMIAKILQAQDFGHIQVGMGKKGERHEST